MARIDVLPSIEIIRGLKGILDFYVWRGLPCVRAWPRYRPARQTDASLAAALTFGAIVKAYSLLANQALLAYREDALDQPRTARDIMVTGVYGNLHEASMSDFLDALIIIRDAVVAQTALINALHSIDTDEIVVRVEHSVIPDDAATHTRQLSMLAALTKIDDLQDALESKALDRLLVRGMDQLHSFNAVLANTRTANPPWNDGYSDSQPVPAGQIWHVTNIRAVDLDTATTQHVYALLHDGGTTYLHAEIAALGAAVASDLQGEWWLDPSDSIRVFMLGSLATDDIRIDLAGEIMTLET